MKRNDTDISFMLTLVSPRAVFFTIFVKYMMILTMTGCLRKKQQVQQVLPMLPMLQVFQLLQRQLDEHSVIYSLEHALISNLNVL